MTHASPSSDDDALLPLDAVRARPAPGGAARARARAGAAETPRTAATARVPKTDAPARGMPEPAAVLPVARVAVDMPLPHLDRPFDYFVPAALDADAVPGSRVRVRFAGKLVDGFLLERAETTEHEGKLARLERVVSAEPVLTPEIVLLARAVADRYAGTLADVLRLAVPPRHARVEAEAAAPTPPRPAPDRRRVRRGGTPPAPGSAGVRERTGAQNGSELRGESGRPASPGRGRTTRMGSRSWRPSPTDGRRGPCGPLCPGWARAGPRGRRRWRRPCGRPSEGAGGPSWSFPTGRTWPWRTRR